MLEERIRIDETSNPVDIKIRRVMKGVFLAQLHNAVKEAVETFPKDIAIVIYGSTIMRQLVDEEGASFPLSGFKSSDIDIGAFTSSRPSTTTLTDAEFQKFITPIVQLSIGRSGFEIWLSESAYNGETHGISEKLSPQEILSGAPLVLKKDFYVSKSFTRAEVVDLLKDDPEFDKLLPYIESHFDAKERPVKTVCLCISPHTEHFPLIMAPISLFRNSDGHGIEQLVRSNRFDMMAGKIARTMRANFKATDIIDIYNLVKGTTKDGNYAINFSPDSPHLALLRLLVINHLLLGYGNFDPKDPHIMHKFQPTEQNYEVFKQATKKQILEYKQEELNAMLPEIFQTASEFMTRLFSKRNQGLSCGPLNLTMGEVSYINEFQGGKRVKAETVTRKRSWQDILLMREPETETLMVGDAGQPFTIDVELLQREYPKVFETYPTIGELLRKNTLLQQKLSFNQYGQSNFDTPGDF